MKVRITFSNDQKDLPITTELKKLVRTVVLQTLRHEDFGYDAELSVSFVTEDEIRALNRDYRGKDRVTDVLSFPMIDGDAGVGDIDIHYGAVELGDVIICAKKAVGQASEYGHGVEREIAFLAVHSVLHLLGYDHERGEEEERTMFQKQDEILEAAGVTRGGNK